MINRVNKRAFSSHITHRKKPDCPTLMWTSHVQCSCNPKRCNTTWSICFSVLFSCYVVVSLNLKCLRTFCFDCSDSYLMISRTFFRSAANLHTCWEKNVFIQVLRLYYMKRKRNYFISCWIFKFANLQKNIETLGCLWIINKLLSYSFRLIHHLFQDHPHLMKQDYFITLCNVFFLLHFSFSSFCLSLLKWNYPKKWKTVHLFVSKQT